MSPTWTPCVMRSNTCPVLQMSDSDILDTVHMYGMFIHCHWNFPYLCLQDRY